MTRIVREIQFTDRQRMRRLLLIAVLSAAGGAGSVWVRNTVQSTGFHWDAALAIFAYLPAICLWIVLSRRRMLRLRALLGANIEIAVVVIVFTVSWFLAYGRFWDDVLGVMILFWIIAAAAATVLLLLLQHWQRPHGGPYCLQCGYCLIGLPSRRCPECGRAFTPEELGITEDELDVKSVIKTDGSFRPEPRRE
jgi:hypothetical protein